MQVEGEFTKIDVYAQITKFVVTVEKDEHNLEFEVDRLTGKSKIISSDKVIFAFANSILDECGDDYGDDDYFSYSLQYKEGDHDPEDDPFIDGDSITANILGDTLVVISYPVSIDEYGRFDCIEFIVDKDFRLIDRRDRDFEFTYHEYVSTKSARKLLN